MGVARVVRDGLRHRPASPRHAHQGAVEMSFNRRNLICAVSGLLLAPLSGRAATRQPPLTLLDAFTAGSNSDYFSRALAVDLARAMARPVLVENHAGGGGAVGAELLARSPADGNVVGMASVSTLVSNPAVNRKLRYDPLNDFTLLTTLVTVPSATVVPADSPLRSLEDTIEAARLRPRALTFGSPGVGSAGHVQLAYFSHLAGVAFNHVPYRGGGPMLIDLLAGRIDVASGNMPLLMPHVRQGRLRVLAVRSLERLPSLAHAPTFKELGFEAVSHPLWFGLVGPAGMPQPVADALSDATRQAVQSDAFRHKAISVAATVETSTPLAFRERVDRWLRTYREMVRVARVQPEQSTRTRAVGPMNAGRGVPRQGA